MTAPKPAAPPTRQAVEHLLGQCLLRFQAYEMLMKSMLTGHRVSGPIAGIEDALRRQANGTARRTLGLLAGEIAGSLLLPQGQDYAPDDIDGLTGPAFAIRLGLALGADELERFRTEQRDLVALRNALVHHFLEDHDLQSEAGCDIARRALLAVDDRVTRALDDLRRLARDVQEARTAMADLLASPEVRDRIAPGRPPRPATPIVQALHIACATLASGDWTSVDAAIEWIAAHHPDETPSRYGCRTWRQVIHASGMFELRLRKAEGRRRAWYRPRVARPELP